MMEIQLFDKFGGGEGAEKRRAEMVQEAGRWFDGLERRLDGREWIACSDFTVADILLATVLRQVRTTGLIDPYPRLEAYHERAQARPGPAAHPQRLLGAAKRDRRGHSLRTRTAGPRHHDRFDGHDMGADAVSVEDSESPGCRRRRMS